ncbi:MAG: hypothetical protein A3D28_04375 [Omnitrophica bacterium RIFCSPHIGHO2_02_FULL_63_14]|nr:MAG: hypothetical protein A3D28_04375 [Omnitrophica bacterium RIFCSPHIGHO2_02_FULL_63_14]
MARFRRKQYFVERGLQLRFARFVILFVFLAALATGLTVFYTTYFLLGQRLADVYPQGRLVEIFRGVHIAFLINLLVIVPLIFYGSILFSHRIAGPLPKIYEALRQIGRGNFDVRLVLRKSDELVDLANTINQAAADLKQREAGKGT